MANRHFDLKNDQNYKKSKDSAAESADESIQQDPRQLDFNDFLFRLPHVDFVEPSEKNQSEQIKKNSSYDFSSWILHKKLSYEHVSKKYFGYSFAIHAVLASFIIFLSVPLIKETSTEVITIEISEDSHAPKGSTPAAIAPVVTEPTIKLRPIPPITKSKALPKSKPISKSKPTAKTEIAAKSKPATHKSVSASHTKSTAARATPIQVPESLDDIKSEDLDSSAVASAHASAQVSQDGLNKDIEHDFNKLDQDSNAEIENESKQLGVLAKNLEAETDENLKSLEQENESQAAAIAAANKERREQEASAIAAERAKENETIAAKNAAAAAAAANAKAAAAAAASAADAEAGAGSGGPSAPGAGQVRSLQDMRQMPGNPKPSYDYQERLRGDAGDIVFWAYVTRDGRTTDFKLLKSTGHRNLDAKTLKALKKWRFYPGQEGWVELPFQWNLNGGVKEMPTLLRRTRSSL